MWARMGHDAPSIQQELDTRFLELEQSLARDIYYLSQDDAHEFPFAVTSIRMTLIVLWALRKDAEAARGHGKRRCLDLGYATRHLP